MSNPTVPERTMYDVSDGIHGILFRYIASKQHDSSLMMAKLLHDGLERLCLRLSEIGVVTVIHQGIYNPRRVRGGLAWSNHAYACGIDLHSFELEDGRIIKCTDWNETHKHPIIQKIWDICKANFTEAIFNNRLHRDHIHAGYKGAQYNSEKAKWQAEWKRRDTVIGQNAEREVDRKLAKQFLTNAWAAIDAKDGDPQTRVLNRITELIKKDYNLD